MYQISARDANSDGVEALISYLMHKNSRPHRRWYLGSQSTPRHHKNAAKMLLRSEKVDHQEVKKGFSNYKNLYYVNSQYTAE
jgi:hypothetical protein